MGSIKRFNLGRIIKEFNIEYFFETGTWKGDGVAYANQFPFKKIYSSEIIPEIADKAKQRFKKNSNIEIIEGNSTDSLIGHLNNMNGNCIFWLDAHFPGAEEGINKYNAFEDEAIKLPLEEEIRQIKHKRSKFNDVILIDDLRIYESGPYASGNLPEGILPPKTRNIDFVFDAFGKTHHVIRSFKDEGYLMVFNKNTYDQFNKGLSAKIRTIGNSLSKKIY